RLHRGPVEALPLGCQGGAEVRGVARELLQVAAHVGLRRGAQLVERHHVAIGHVAEREVHPPGAEAIDRRRQLDPGAPIDPLTPWERRVARAGAADRLRRSVVEPLIAYGSALGAAPALDELEQRALADRDRCDRARLEIAVLADPRDVDPLVALEPAAVE